MNGPNLKPQLEKLHELIMAERECAKNFDLEGLESFGREKEELLGVLENVSGLGSELRGLAENIKRENRRNAYLFWAALRYIRESMSFFTGQLSPACYGAGGNLIQRRGSGLVLTGRM